MCDQLYYRLASAVHQAGLPASQRLLRSVEEYSALGPLPWKPPADEVLSLEFDEVRIFGAYPGNRLPGVYQTWSFRYESCCQPSIESNPPLLPVEVNSPVMSEAEWLLGFPQLSAVLGSIDNVTGGRIHLNQSYGCHVHVGLSKDKLSSLPSDAARSATELIVFKRALTLVVLLEKHLLCQMCPGRSQTGFAGLPVGEGLTDPGKRVRRRTARCLRQMRAHLPPVVERRLRRTLAVIWSCDKTSQLSTRACRSKDGNRTHVALGKVQPDKPLLDNDSARLRQYTLEFRMGPSSASVTFLRTWVSIILAVMRLSSADIPEADFSCLVGDIYRTTKRKKHSSTKTAAALVDILRSRLGRGDDAVPFDDEAFNARGAMYGQGRDPNLDDAQVWAAK